MSPRNHSWLYHPGALSSLSIYWNSLKDRVPVDFIYGYPIFKWIAVTWQYGRVVLMMATRGDMPLVDPLICIMYDIVVLGWREWEVVQRSSWRVVMIWTGDGENTASCTNPATYLNRVRLWVSRQLKLHWHWPTSASEGASTVSIHSCQI